MPAGKLAIADLEVTTRDEVAELERAGVDAVIVAPRQLAGLVRADAARGLTRLASADRWAARWVALAALLVLGRCAAARRHPVRPSVSAPANPDERNIVPRAWAMTHGGGLDPHWFDYPTLVMYLLAPFQAWQRRALVPDRADRRWSSVRSAGSRAAWWLGRAAYGPVAGFVAAAAVAVETTHVAYSRMAVTDVPLTLGVTVALALMVSGRIELAGLAVGLAASAKYPGIILLAPLVAAAWGGGDASAIGASLAVVALRRHEPVRADRLRRPP